jgi:hypothetical protein
VALGEQWMKETIRRIGTTMFPGQLAEVVSQSIRKNLLIQSPRNLAISA